MSSNVTSTGTGTVADPASTSSPLTTPTSLNSAAVDETSTDTPTTTAPAADTTTSAPASPTSDTSTSTSAPAPTTSETTSAATTPTTTATPTTATTPTTTTPTTIVTSPSTTTTPTTTPTSTIATTPSSTTSTSESTTTSAPTSTTTSAPQSTVVTTQITSSDANGSTTVVIVTSTRAVDPTSASGTAAATNSAGLLGSDNSTSSTGLSSSGKIAIAVVVPIAAVALLVVAAIFLWRKRKQRKDAEEERRKEVEDYIYNPNADPTLPDVGSSAGGAYEMKEDASSGYRGWGSTTLGGSTGRKASTTMSGGAAGVAYSDGTQYGNVSDTRSGEPLMSDGSHSPEGEILGAMGPATADNRGNVHRGPSNASSSYSAAGRSDGSGENGVGVAYGGPAYYDSYGSNPYDGTQQGASQPIIRDNPARRNTRIENPSHYPQQSAGISQNF